MGLQPRDITEALGVPCLGWVPAVPARALRGQFPLLGHVVPPGFLDAIRALRTAVIFASPCGGPNSVMVTSTAQGEGKSVVSSNLATALAQVGLRTLLLDADMRRPRVHEVFGCPQVPGLSDVLAGMCDARLAIRTTARPNLSVLPAGNIPSDPLALLGPVQSRRLLGDLGRHYDWIVVDAPPVTPVTDAAALAGNVSGVVFVVGAETTKRRAAQSAMEQLVVARARMVGAILNHASPRAQMRYAHGQQTDYTQGYGAHSV